MCKLNLDTVGDEEKSFKAEYYNAFIFERNINHYNKRQIPASALLSNHLVHIAKGINTYSKKYEKILLMDDFNVACAKANTAGFCNECKLQALNKEPTCFKNRRNASFIDLYLTNSPKKFRKYFNNRNRSFRFS